MSTRKTNKERTRQKLVQATLKILHKQGPTALTTGRIAQAAGVAQPTFYVHFKAMDEALEEAAAVVADAILSDLNRYRDGIADGASPRAAVRHALVSGVDAFTADRRNAELFLRHRRDVVSPLGRRWRELTDTARDALTADLHARGVGKHVDDLVVLADSIIGLTLTLTESILDGRVTNRTAAVDMMVRGLEASMTSPHMSSLGVSAA